MKSVISIFFAAMLLAMLIACAQRPLVHHPQPEDSFKAQSRVLVLSFLDAWLQGDTIRLSSYLNTMIGIIPSQNSNAPLEKDVVLSSLLAEREKQVFSGLTDLATLLDLDAIAQASVFDLKSCSPPFNDFCSMNDKSFPAKAVLVLVPLKTRSVEKETTKAFLAFVVIPGPEGAVISALNFP